MARGGLDGAANLRCSSKSLIWLTAPMPERPKSLIWLTLTAAILLDRSTASIEKILEVEENENRFA